MKLIVCENYDDMSAKAAELIKEQVKEKPNSILGLATGSTPVGMYRCLTEMYKNGEIDFKDVTTFNLDEYYPISNDDPQSYHTFMKENLFSHINVPADRIHIPNGDTSDPIAECESYEAAIKEHGGVDLQILGIGRNGHIGFNEPSMRLNTSTHITALTNDTIDANSRFFENAEKVPTHALTMGISTILASKKIILLASGRSKNDAIKELLSDAITTNNPSTMLKVHPDFTLICDRDAYSDIRLGVDIGGMSAKIGAVDNGEIIDRMSVPVEAPDGEALANAIAEACSEMMKKHSVRFVGVGTPGIITGGKIDAANLPFKDYPLGEVLGEKLGLPVKIENDANCAALGETLAGAGRGAQNLLLVTLGTGIGLGIISDGHIYSGRGAAGEAGHMCIEYDGLPCPCGEKGCWEQYASASALIRETKEAAAANPDSILAECAKNEVNGKTVFEAMDKGCETAKAVYDKYLDYLAVGITNLANIFDPEAIIISGGLSNEGARLSEPLCEKLKIKCDIRIASLKNDAGIIGAASLDD